MGPTAAPFQDLYSISLIQPMDVDNPVQYIDNQNATLVVELAMQQVLDPIKVSCAANFSLTYSSASGQIHMLSFITQDTSAGTVYIEYLIFYKDATSYTDIVSRELTAVTDGTLQAAVRELALKYYPSLGTVVINQPPVFVSPPPGSSSSPSPINSSSSASTSNALSAGALIGIVVGGVFLLSIVSICIFYWYSARKAKNVTQLNSGDSESGSLRIFLRNTFSRNTWGSPSIAQRSPSALQMSSVRTTNTNTNVRTVETLPGSVVVKDSQKGVSQLTYGKKYKNPDELYEDLFADETSKRSSQPGVDKRYTNPDELYEDLFGMDADRALSTVQKHVVTADERRSLRLYNSDTKKLLMSEEEAETTAAAALADNPMIESEFSDIQPTRDSAEFKLVAANDSNKLVFVNKGRNSNVMRLDEDTNDANDQSQLPEPQDFYRSSVFVSYADEAETRRASMDPDTDRY